MSTPTAAPTSQLLYTPTEAAVVLSVGRSTVYELMAAGQLPFVQVRRVRKIRRADLERFVADLPAVAC
jgi:excisionase family DNA binding protein